MKNLVSQKWTAGFLASMLLLLAGCATTPPAPTPYPIQVELDSALQGKSVLVDLVGVNQGNFDRWNSYPMSKYWKDGDVMRANATKVTYNFVAGAPKVNTLALNDPIWAKWKAAGAAHVFILADLPGVQADQVGVQDARRQILGLRPDAWTKGTKDLKVLIKESGIEVVTPLRTK